MKIPNKIKKLIENYFVSIIGGLMGGLIIFYGINAPKIPIKDWIALPMAIIFGFFILLILFKLKNKDRVHWVWTVYFITAFIGFIISLLFTIGPY